MRVQRRMLWFDLVGPDQQVSEDADGVFEVIKVLATADVKFFYSFINGKIFYIGEIQNIITTIQITRSGRRLFGIEFVNGI